MLGKCPLSDCHFKHCINAGMVHVLHAYDCFALYLHSCGVIGLFLLLNAFSLITVHSLSDILRRTCFLWLPVSDYAKNFACTRFDIRLKLNQAVFFGEVHRHLFPVAILKVCLQWYSCCLCGQCDSAFVVCRCVWFVMRVIFNDSLVVCEANETMLFLYVHVWLVMRVIFSDSLVVF